MRRTRCGALGVVALGAASIALAACEAETDREVLRPETPAAERADSAIQTAPEWMHEQRADLEVRARRLVDEAEEELADAQQATDAAEGTVRASLRAQRDRVVRQVEAVQRELALLRNAGEEGWDAAVARLHEEMNELVVSRRELGQALEGQEADRGSP